jgi:hypothetical protein
MDWSQAIVDAQLARRLADEADAEHIWKYPDPELPASENDVAELEHKLGFSLDKQLRNFLLHANGWKALYYDVDLFGTSDFLAGERFDRATMLIETMEPLKELCGFERHELMPIAVSLEAIGVCAISTPASHNPGEVVRFNGSVYEHFRNFEEWFLKQSKI